MYHMLRFRTGYLTVVPPQSNPRYMCFRHHMDAKKCRDYISDYKKKYNKWPNMDMNVAFNKVELNENRFCDFGSVISIEEIDEQKFNDVANLSLSDMLICTEFNVDMSKTDKIEISFKGIEVDYEFDTETIIKTLNK